MRQLTFFSQWYDHYIGKKMFCNYGNSSVQIISNFEFRLDQDYLRHIYVSFENISFRQIFSNKDHFINWFDHLGEK